MYPAAECLPPCRGRSDAPPATDRRRRLRSAPSAGCRFRPRPAHGLAVLTATSCRSGSACAARATLPSGAASVLARPGARVAALDTIRIGPSPRTSFSTRVAALRRALRRALRSMSTTRRRISTTDLLLPSPCLPSRPLPSRRPRSSRLLLRRLSLPHRLRSRSLRSWPRRPPLSRRPSPRRRRRQWRPRSPATSPSPNRRQSCHRRSPPRLRLRLHSSGTLHRSRHTPRGPLHRHLLPCPSSPMTTSTPTTISTPGPTSHPIARPAG